MHRVLFAVVLAALGLSQSAQARTMQQRLDAACADDIRKLCPHEAAADTLKACMLDHRAEVRRDCMKLIDASE